MAEDKTMILKIQADVSDLKKQLSAIDTQIKKVGTDGTATGKKLKKGFNNAESGLASFKKSIMSVQGIMGGLMVKGVYDMATAQRKLAMQTEALRSNRAYGGLAQDFENIESATQGMVNQFEIVGAVNKAMAFGIDLSGGKLKQLITSAQKASVAMGTDLKSSIDDMMTAMGRGSVMIADNLGATFKLSEAHDAYAKKLGVSTSALSDQQKKIAFNEMFLSKLETAYQHLGNDQLYDPIIANQKRLSKGWQDAKEVGTDFLTGIVLSVQDAAKDIASMVSNSDDELINSQKKKIEALEKTMIDAGISFKDRVSSSGSGFLNFAKLNYDELKTIHANYTKLIENSRINDLNYLKAEGSMLADNLLTLEKTKKLQSVSARGNVDMPNMLTNLPAFTISPESEKKMKKYRDNLDSIKKKNQDAAQKRAIAIKDVERELKLKIESGIYSEKEIFLLNQKWLKLQEISKAGKIGVDIDTKKGLAGIEKEAQDKKDAEAKIVQDKKDAVQLEQEIVQAGYDFEASMYENHQKEMKERRNIENAAKLDEMKTQARREARIDEMQKAATFTMAKGAIDALIALDEKLFLQSIASAASTAGQAIFMDGLTTMWAGISKNTLFPGWGSDAVSVGVAEMAVGTGLMVGGGLASNAIGSSGTSSSSGSQERNTESSEDKVIQTDVKVSLYPSRTAMKKDFTNNGILIKG